MTKKWLQGRAYLLTIQAVYTIGVASATRNARFDDSLIELKGVEQIREGENAPLFDEVRWHNRNTLCCKVSEVMFIHVPFNGCMLVAETCLLRELLQPSSELCQSIEIIPRRTENNAAEFGPINSGVSPIHTA